MTQVPSNGFLPGTILTVRSTRFPAIKHWGVVDWLLDENGQPSMWHSQKSDVLRRTDHLYFSSGQPCEVLWVPQTREQQTYIIERLRSKTGLPWNLARANCEQVVRWALEGRPRSQQLEAGFVLALSAIFVGLVVSSKAS
jgi:hypothetical protein